MSLTIYLLQIASIIATKVYYPFAPMIVGVHEHIMLRMIGTIPHYLQLLYRVKHR